MAVRGQPDFFSRPFHTDRGSFLVIYRFDDEAVVLLAIRPIPASSY